MCKGGCQKPPLCKGMLALCAPCQACPYIPRLCIAQRYRAAQGITNSHRTNHACTTFPFRNALRYRAGQGSTNPPTAPSTHIPRFHSTTWCVTERVREVPTPDCTKHAYTTFPFRNMVRYRAGQGSIDPRRTKHACTTFPFRNTVRYRAGQGSIDPRLHQARIKKTHCPKSGSGL